MANITFTITYDGTPTPPPVTITQPSTTPLPLSFDPNAGSQFTGYVHNGNNVGTIAIDLQLVATTASLTIAPITGGTASLHRATPKVPTSATKESSLQWSTTGTSTAKLEITAGLDPVDLDLTAGDRTPKPVKIHITRPLAQPAGPPLAPGSGPRGSARHGGSVDTGAFRKLAVVVGANVYADQGVGLLRGAVADAAWMHGELTARGFESVLLLDADATQSAIQGALGQALQNAMPSDLVVFYFAGHGTQFVTLDDGLGGMEGVLREAICPYDFDPARAASAISDEQLLHAAGRCKGRVLVVLDACFSGGFANDPGQPGLLPHPPHGAARFTATLFATPRAKHESSFVAPFPPALRRAAAVFTACGKKQRAAEGEFDEGFRGAFTRFLGDRIAGGAAVEMVTLRKDVEDDLTGHGFHQEPELETKEPHRHFAE